MPISTFKVLGLTWDTRKDTLSMAFHRAIEDVNNHMKMTKRKVLSIAAKLFDPLGFIEPFLVKAKIMIQNLWKAKLDWDDELPDHLAKEWRLWLEDNKHLTSITVRRSYFSTGNPQTVQMHVFCDSSTKTYEEVVYLRSTTKIGVQVSMVMSKSRVSPLKKLTLPTLELLAASVGSKLSRYIVDKLQSKFGKLHTFL